MNCYILTKNKKVLHEIEAVDLMQISTMPALDLYKLVIALLNPRDPVNLFNLIDSNYVGIQLDIQGLHGLGTEEQVKKLTDNTWLCCNQ